MSMYAKLLMLSAFLTMSLAFSIFNFLIMPSLVTAKNHFDDHDDHDGKVDSASTHFLLLIRLTTKEERNMSTEEHITMSRFVKNDRSQLA